MTQKDTCTPIFIAVLFIIAKTQKQPKCPSTEVHKEDVVIYAMEYCSATKNNEIMSFEAAWMDLENATLSEVSQTENEKYHKTFLICRISKEML